MSLLEIKNLKVYFPRQGDSMELRAVDDVSLSIEDGESVGIVGESGCGKTTLGNAVIGLVPVTDGEVLFKGQMVHADSTRRGFRGNALKEFRKQVQMVFQDPFGSLNPRMTAGACISEVFRANHRGLSGDVIRQKVSELLEMVGLDPQYADRYPHEFSGGQRQRIGIARAIAVGPSLIIADEPVSALDVSVQVQILNLMKDLHDRMNLSYIFIAHDLAVVRYMCDRILVMYLGKIVESANAGDIFSNPAHPYTEALLSAVPDVEKGLKARHDKTGSDRIILKGDVPSATMRISGCPFHPRCHRMQEICREKVPDRKEVGDGHFSVCHFTLSR